MDLAPGASIKTASIPNGVRRRCENIINTYPGQVKGRPLPALSPVTAGGVTYTITSVQVAGNLLKIDWQASGRPVDEFGAAAYPTQPPADQLAVLTRFQSLHLQYLQPSVLDDTGSRMQEAGAGRELPRTRPYTRRGQVDALIPGPGQYTLALGCAGQARLPTVGEVPNGACSQSPNAAITIVVS